MDPLPSLARKRKAAEQDDDPKCSPQDAPDNPPRLSIDSPASWFPAGIPLDPSPMPSPTTAPSSPLTAAPCSSSSVFDSDAPSPKRPRIGPSRAPSPAAPKTGKRAQSRRAHDLVTALQTLHGSSWRWMTSRTGETRLVAPAPLPLGPHPDGLLSSPDVSPPNSPTAVSSPVVIPIDPCSPHIPLRFPTINRETLKELDLDAIMRNPQLRHDFLFDSGLTFRASTSRRKRDQAQTYWKAVELELRTGCTCVTFDLDGRPQLCVCVCKRVPAMPTDPVIACLPQRRRLTLRMPSRVKPLIHELRAVLISIVNPQRPSFLNTYKGNKTYAECQEQNAQHARRLDSLLDPDLIQQEVEHGVFDPSGTFQAIGEILKAHCAPMRDAMIDVMVHKANKCAPGGSGTMADAVQAIRTCFEILELMKLDVANHQMQTLRPHIVQSSPRFELRVFKDRHNKGQASLAITQQWLALGHQRLDAAQYNLRYPARPLPYDSLSRRTRVVLSTLRGMIDLVFTPPSPVPLSVPTLTAAAASTRQPTPFETHLPGHPETLYLDHSRLEQLTKDTADLTTLYMLLMLYRQLVCASPAKGAPPPKRDPASDDAHIERIKREILELAPTNFGRCFLPVRAPCPHHPPHTDGADVQRWTDGMRGIVLQVAARASEVRRGRKSESLATAPEPGLLKLAESWSDSHLRLDSPLAEMMRNRLREAVFELLVHTVVMRGNDSPLASASPRVGSLKPASVTGLEALGPELRQLTERLAKLAVLHLNVYQSVYEQDGFGAGGP